MAATVPELRNLQRTIPVGNTNSQHGISVTLESVDLYDDGLACNLRLRSDSISMNGNPWLKLTVRDDRGNTFACYPNGGHGHAGPHQIDWDMSFKFPPPIDPSASDLQIDINEVGRLDFDPSRIAQGKPRMVDGITGVWSFTVPLN